MNEHTVDGEVHALSDNLAYISTIIKEDSNFLHVEKIKQDMIEKFVLYQLKNDPKKCIDILKSHFAYSNPACYETIYRPPWIISSLQQNGVLSLKFPRIENDGLDDGC